MSHVTDSIPASGSASDAVLHGHSQSAGVGAAATGDEEVCL